jgi:hypothetical protein
MKNDELDPKLKQAFNNLQNIPPRTPQAAARGRANFLRQAVVLRQTVSQKKDQRQNRWNNLIFPLFQRKERLPVLNTVIAVVFAITVFFGVPGATVYAAQGSLPDQALYPVKTWSEDVILSLTGSPQMRMNYALDFSDRRVEELSSLLTSGKPVPDGVETRLQNELDLVLKLAAGMDDHQAIQQMVQIRQRAEAQMQTTVMLLSGAPGSTALLLRTQTRLQAQIQLAAMGESDMPRFRMQVQQRFQNQGYSGEPTPGTGNNTQGPGPMSPTDKPGPSGTGNGPGSGMNQPTGMPGPSATSNAPGSGMNQPTGMPGSPSTGNSPDSGMNQPTRTPCQYDPASRMPDQTPQPGGGSGNNP